MEKNSFFYDNSEGNPAELLIDYFLSWTLRCAIDEEQEYISETVKKYSKEVLYYFLKPALGGVEKGDIKVLKVETVKQWKKIDLLCVIDAEIIDEPTSFALAFENKMYTKLHDNQLEIYKKAIDERYPDESIEIEKLFIYITTHKKVPSEDWDHCEVNGYRALTLREVTGHLQDKYDDIRSGNALFDEFWYNFKRE